MTLKEANDSIRHLTISVNKNCNSINYKCFKSSKGNDFLLDKEDFETLITQMESNLIQLKKDWINITQTKKILDTPTLSK